ncbi:MAG: histidine kinase [Desulfovibrionaceae bacterium]|nr:histidine kinase [Desulfovibrionaceae bacterium]
MIDDILDWREALARFESRGAYERRLRELLPVANDSVTTLFALIGRGQALPEEAREKAVQVVHEVREHAAEVGARRLAARAMELELAIRGGADLAQPYGLFSSAVPDTLCTISGFLG